MSGGPLYQLSPANWDQLTLNEAIKQMRELGIGSITVGYGSEAETAGAFILVEGKHTAHYLAKLEELRAELDDEQPANGS